MLGGCEKTFENMYHQDKYKPLAESALWSDGRSARPPVAHTVPHSGDTVADTSSGRLGVEPPVAETSMSMQFTASIAKADRLDQRAGDAPTLGELERGRERYDIYCAPCHSVTGDGDGMIVRRGFPRPSSFHSDRLRNANDAFFDAAIVHGYGTMYAHAGTVEPADRRAIIAYIRALQLAQHASLDTVPTDVRARLGSAP
jgi:mono/diheme cytochrome c family protein